MKYFWLCVVALFVLGSIAAAQVTVSDSVEFKIKNVNSGLVLGISGQSQTAGTSVVQWTDNGTPDHLWHFMPMGNGQYNIENMLTHQVLGISGASKSNGAQVLEWADNGTADHLWVCVLTQGTFKYNAVVVNPGRKSNQRLLPSFQDAYRISSPKYCQSIPL